MELRKPSLALVVATVLVPSAQAATLSSNKATITIIAAKSFCVPTGISDVYTGDGKVTFYITLRNSGSSSGKVNIVPVRHYDDGGINESAMDMLVNVAVPAGAIKKYRSPSYSYKAHEHEVSGCGLKIGSGHEVRIKVLHA